jgi:competence protein ComEA
MVNPDCISRILARRRAGPRPAYRPFKQCPHGHRRMPTATPGRFRQKRARHRGRLEAWHTTCPFQPLRKEHIMLRKLVPLALALSLSLPALAATPVNVNTADAVTIAKSLDGVGPSKARAIVAYRKAHGRFKHVEDLAKVKGIGKATLKHNRKDIRLGGGK